MSGHKRRERLESIDVLRGLVMVLMALDHARDFFHDVRVIVESQPAPGAALFLTRWVTHFCAPVFVFLAGASAWLWRARGRSAWQTSRYLATRGLWLVALEWSAVHFVWFGATYPGLFVFQVIGAIGGSMVVLALLVHLPRAVVLALGLALVAGHNLLDAHACEEPFGGCPWWWILLHQEGLFSFAPRFMEEVLLYVKYPLLPWIGVMATGYGAGALFELPRGARRGLLLAAGLLATAGFVVLRAANAYGDPVPFSEQVHGDAAWMRFLNCEKYPPSLLFLLMTLGPALIFLALADGTALAASRLGSWLSTFGRVPLFFYLAHVLLLRLGAEAYWRTRGELPPNLILERFPADYGLPLGWTYAAWLAALALLYFPCRWYAALKRRSSLPLLTYL